MGIEVAVVGIWAALATVAAGLFWSKAKAHVPPEPLSSGAKAAALPAKSPPAGEALLQLEKKLAEVRTELTSSKERLTTKQKELDEMKEQAKLRAKREGKKDQREQDEAAAAAAKPAGVDPRDIEIQALRKGMASLESQLNSLKREQTQTTASSADLTQKTADEVAAAKKAADSEYNRRRSLEEEASALRKTLDELRNAMKKADNRPDVPGTTLNLKELPAPAVQELSRYFRKGEEFERLYTVAQSQLQLEKDRFLELQRRYFAVCRELAVQAGLPANANEAEYRQKAEAVIDSTSDRMAERRGERGQGQGQPAQGQAAVVQLGPDGQPLPAQDGMKKKRRRRRRRKIAGETSVVEAGAAGEAESEDGGDEGGEGGEDDGPDDSSSTPPVAGDSGASAPA